MKKLKKNIIFATVIAMLTASSSSVNAADVTDTGGYGYEECRRAPQVGPAIALGAIALAAVIAVAVQSSSHGHGHSHTQ